MQDLARPGREEHPPTPTPAGAACSTSTARPTASSTDAPGAAPGARRRLDDRQQGPAGHPADAAHGRQGLGLRRDQLPARAARPVPGARDRRQEGDRLDPREHRGVRRQPRLHRDHRRLGGRPPDRAGRADRRTTRRTSPASRTPTPPCRPPSRTTASTTSPASTGLRSAELLRDGFLAPRILQKTLGRRPRASSRRPRRSCGSPTDAPDFFVLHGNHDTLVPVDQARLFVEKLRRGLEADRRVRRAPRRPARLRRLPVDPIAPTSSAPSTATSTGTGTAGGPRDRTQTAGRGEGAVTGMRRGLGNLMVGLVLATAVAACGTDTGEPRRRRPGVVATRRHRARPRRPWDRSPT